MTTPERRGEANPNYKGHMHRLCKQCGAPLGVGASKTTKYCSKECYDAAQRIVNYAQVCAWCGKDFLHRANRHCSTACAKAHRDHKRATSKRDKTSVIGQPKKPRSLRVCEVCGKGMLLLPSDVRKDKKYCSRACYGKAVSGRQKGSGHPNYKDGMSKERTSQRQRLRAHPQYKQWVKDVLQRDRYSCRTCGAKGVELHVHHHVAWVDDPRSRLKVGNGVTLCAECHRLWHLYNRKGLFEKKEALLQQKIIDALRGYGFYVYNVPGTPMGVNGTPDILVCFNGIFGGVEVKVYPNYLSELQRVAGERIKAAGGIFYVAQSEDDIGRIIETFELKTAEGNWIKEDVSK